MKNIVILGATGNLGLQCIEVIKKYPEKFRIIGLSGYRNKALLKKLASTASHARSLGGTGPTLTAATTREILKLATHKNTDIIINAISGIAGLNPTIAALKAGKIVILANKESLFLAGEKIMKLARLGENLIPLDSEHNAVFEILKLAVGAMQAKAPISSALSQVRKIILTGTGGAFLGKTRKQLQKVTAKDALQNSRWKMGAKITIESATLINKGLEIIEAHHFFNVPLKNIDVRIDKTASLHAIVEFKNGKMLGYFSPPDMRHHVEISLQPSSRPLSHGSEFTRAVIREISRREFARLPSPDHNTFPGIKLVLSAYQKFAKDKAKRIIFLKKEEATIAKYIKGQITFPEIYMYMN